MFLCGLAVFLIWMMNKDEEEAKKVIWTPVPSQLASQPNVTNIILMKPGESPGGVPGVGNSPAAIAAALASSPTPQAAPASAPAPPPPASPTAVHLEEQAQRGYDRYPGRPSPRDPFYHGRARVRESISRMSSRMSSHIFRPRGRREDDNPSRYSNRRDDEEPSRHSNRRDDEEPSRHRRRDDEEDPSRRSRRRHDGDRSRHSPRPKSRRPRRREET